PPDPVLTDSGEDSCASRHLLHPKNGVAAERATGHYHLDAARGCARGHTGLDERGRDDGEFRWGAVEGDAGRAGQIGAENFDGGSNFAECRESFNERAEADIETEDSAVIA